MAMTLHIGDTVIYPVLGACRFVEEVTQEVAGHSMTLYKFQSLFGRSQTALLPLAQLERSTLRSVSTEADIAEALEIAAGTSRGKSLRTHQKSVKFQDLLKENTLYSVATILRDTIGSHSGQIGELGRVEQEAFETAFHILAAEMVIAHGIDYSAAKKQILDFILEVPSEQEAEIQNEDSVESAPESEAAAEDSADIKRPSSFSHPAIETNDPLYSAFKGASDAPAEETEEKPTLSGKELDDKIAELQQNINKDTEKLYFNYAEGLSKNDSRREMLDFFKDKFGYSPRTFDIVVGLNVFPDSQTNSIKGFSDKYNLDPEDVAYYGKSGRDALDQQRKDEERARREALAQPVYK